MAADISPRSSGSWTKRVDKTQTGKVTADDRWLSAPESCFEIIAHTHLNDDRQFECYLGTHPNIDRESFEQCLHGQCRNVAACRRLLTNYVGMGDDIPVNPANLDLLYDDDQNSITVSNNLYWRLQYNDPTKTNLGKGSYGSVILVESAIEPHRKYAIKIVRGDAPVFPQELAISQYLNHPNIIKFRDIRINDNYGYYIMPAAVGDLSRPEFTEMLASSQFYRQVIFFQILAGLDYAHQRGIYHLDLKPQNVLVMPQVIVDMYGVECPLIKIGDFGISSVGHHQARKYNEVVTLWWTPPELLLCSTKYDQRVDSWSVGIMMINAIYGMNKFPGHNPADQLELYTQVCGRLNASPETTLSRFLEPMAKCPVKNSHKSSQNPKEPLADLTEFLKGGTTATNFGEVGVSDMLSLTAEVDLIRNLLIYNTFDDESLPRRPTAGEVLQHDYFIEMRTLPSLRTITTDRQLDGPHDQAWWIPFSVDKYQSYADSAVVETVKLYLNEFATLLRDCASLANHDKGLSIYTNIHDGIWYGFLLFDRFRGIIGYNESQFPFPYVLMVVAYITVTMIMRSLDFNHFWEECMESAGYLYHLSLPSLDVEKAKQIYLTMLAKINGRVIIDNRLYLGVSREEVQLYIDLYVERTLTRLHEECPK